MNIRSLNLGYSAREMDKLSLLSDRIIFSAQFIKSNNLEKFEYVNFLMDDDDAYFLGFIFMKQREPGTLKILTQSRGNKISGSRIVKTVGLYNLHPIAKKVSKFKNPKDRTFQIIKDINESFYKVIFRPIFENSSSYSERNLIPIGSGIYRYYDKSAQLIYIGKGVIRDRANIREREEWGIEKIEYSFLNSDDESFHWETYYIQKYEDEYGTIPMYNRIRGRSEKNT